ncbi:MAG: N-acetyltransferase [Peptococcaceae bacterium]|jgi:amino-acid N-acetyltransferase|nr:N-acetyltransferase [Peptococcaceae bacterium]
MIFRHAVLKDVEAIIALVNGYAEQGLMLPRSRNMLYENIREFLIIEELEQVIGVASLHIVWEDLAEIRALAIHSTYAKQGLGAQLVRHLLQEAAQLGCKKVFALTYRTDFFERCGFRIVDKEDMPSKVWKECINCIKFPNCDEVAVMITLSASDYAMVT